MLTQTPAKPHFTLLATSFPGGPRPRNAAIILFGLWFLLFFAALFSPPILDDADATHAQAARAMASTGDLVTLHVDGVRYLEKAPLPYWLSALCFRLFGFNTFAAHLPQALAVLLLMLLGHRWANQAFGARTGFYTAVAILTSFGVFLFTRILIPEALLSLFLAASLFAFLKTLGPLATSAELPAVPSAERDTQPQYPTPPSRLVLGEIFASPQQGSMGLEEALLMSGGPEIDLFIQTAREIEARHGVVIGHSAATGVWNSGAEPSVVSRAEAGIDLETLHVIAAIRGKAANQDAVLTWYNDSSGPHLRYVVDLKGVGTQQAANRLLASGIEYATVQKTERGVQIDIIELSSDPETKEVLEDRLYEYFSDADIYDRSGYGQILWKQATTPDQSQWTYDQVITRYSQRSGHSQARRRTARVDHHESRNEGTVASRTGSLASKSALANAAGTTSVFAAETKEHPSIAFYAGPLFYPYIMWATLACSVLTKGLVALVFFVATTLSFLLLTGTFKQDWRKLRPATGLLLFLVIAAPWHILAGLRNTGGLNGHGFFWFYFVNEHVLRFLGRRTPADFNKLPSYLYWTSNLIWLFPWTLFLPLAFAALRRRVRHQTATLTANIPQDDSWAGAALVVGFSSMLIVIWEVFLPEWFEPAVLIATLFLIGRIGSRRVRARLTPSPFHRIDPQQRTILLLSLFSAIVLIFFSLSTNQEYYTFPVYLPVLLLIAATITRAEQTFTTNPSARRWIAFAHAAFTVAGAAIALALFYGLWASRKLPYLNDIGLVLAHRGVGDYTLSLSHFFDLTTQSFAALRLPALLAGFVFAFGPALAWLLRIQRRHLAATTSIALTSAAFLFAAHLAFARFAPMLSSQSFAAHIQKLESGRRIQPDTQILIFGDQAFGSSIPFYLGRPVLLVDGRTTSMLFGSTFPDAPPIFLNSPQLHAGWGSGPRKLLFVPAERRAEVDRLLGPRQIILQETSGKALLTDRPLAP